MIIDTSALLAIIFDEPDGPHENPAKAPALDELIETLDIDIEPVTVQQARVARGAYHLYGKGKHPAGLNYGDCFAYALAKAMHQPLLFKGNDFSQTDIEAAPRDVDGPA
jgi:ribonuclease VapC